VRPNRLTLVVTAVVALVLLSRLVVYQVKDDEVAVVLTFGRATEDIATPRTGLKWPWPIQQVRRFDHRLRVLRAPLEEVATQDGRAVLVGSFVLWRVGSAQEFLQRVGDPEAASLHLEKALRSRQTEMVSRYDFAALVSTDPQALKYVELEQRIQAALAEDVRPLGIEVASVGIRRLSLPEEATEAVFDRMKKDREARAAKLQAEGEAEAGRIRAQADQERDTLIAAAQAEAKTLLGEAERKAEQAYAVRAEAPDLAIFLEELEALRQMLRGRTTLVFDTTQPPFDLLRRATERGQ
jgi:modulator of FtsH protease HflC